MKLIPSKSSIEFQCRQVIVRPCAGDPKLGLHELSVPDDNQFPLFMMTMTAADRVLLARKLVANTDAKIVHHDGTELPPLR